MARLAARRRRRRRELLTAGLGAVAAVTTLPQTGTVHGAEIAAVLLLASLAVIAGHRWALAILTLAELSLVAALSPKLTTWPPDPVALATTAIAIAAMVPGLFRTDRAAVGLAELCGIRKNPRNLRTLRHAMWAVPAMSLLFGW